MRSEQAIAAPRANMADLERVIWRGVIGLVSEKFMGFEKVIKQERY